MEPAFIGTVKHANAVCKTCGDGKVEMVTDRYGEWVFVPCTKCVSPLPKNWYMKPPRKTDGSRILVYFSQDGRVFVDTKYEFDEENHLIHRGGPEYPMHFHRFEDYGLADGLVRCRKCGLVRENK